MNAKFLFFAFMLFSISFGFVACDEEDDIAPQTNTIVDLAVSNSQFSTLVDALEAANLVSVLQGPGPFTVLAPTNAAFADFLAANNFNSLNDIPVDVLTQVLLNHVISGAVRSTDLTEGYVATLSTNAPDDENLSLYVDLSSGVTFNGNAKVSTADILADNGIIHEIDAVIATPTVVTHALSNDNFSTLVAALTRADLMVDYVATLTGAGPFTVFAPTNAAFQELLNSNDAWGSLDDIPAETLESVLNYHVVAGANVRSSALTDEMMVEALEGSFIIDLDGDPTIKTTSGGTSTIIATDVQGSNGVVHVINSVLIP